MWRQAVKLTCVPSTAYATLLGWLTLLLTQRPPLPLNGSCGWRYTEAGGPHSSVSLSSFL